MVPVGVVTHLGLCGMDPTRENLLPIGLQKETTSECHPPGVSWSVPQCSSQKQGKEVDKHNSHSQKGLTSLGFIPYVFIGRKCLPSKLGRVISVLVNDMAGDVWWTCGQTSTVRTWHHHCSSRTILGSCDGPRGMGGPAAQPTFVRSNTIQQGLGFPNHRVQPSSDIGPTTVPMGIRATDLVILNGRFYTAKLNRWQSQRMADQWYGQTRWTENHLRQQDLSLLFKVSI